jgi:uncharacterized protein YbjT (DUF2867 family)
VGDQGDEKFLVVAFAGCEAVYLIIPSKFDAENVRDYYNRMGDIAVEAIKMTGVQKVVFLSSLGAEQEFGTGPVLGLHDVEQKLTTLDDVDIVFLRPGYFMENTLGNIPLIKGQNIIGNPSDPEVPFYMVATKDIAVKAADLLSERSFTGHSVIDLYGERISYDEITQAIAEKISNPDLQFVQFTDQDAIHGFRGMGLSQNIAESFVELAHAMEEGRVHVTQASVEKPTSPTKYNQFVEEVFYPAYKSS